MFIVLSCCELRKSLLIKREKLLVVSLHISLGIRRISYLEF